MLRILHFYYCFTDIDIQFMVRNNSQVCTVKYAQSSLYSQVCTVKFVQSSLYSQVSIVKSVQSSQYSQVCTVKSVRSSPQKFQVHVVTYWEIMFDDFLLETNSSYLICN